MGATFKSSHSIRVDDRLSSSPEGSKWEEQPSSSSRSGFETVTVLDDREIGQVDNKTNLG